ncbi:hypothetical protein C8J56DRAFT_1113960 [Mycena floridula]|nr:hypothetical protein C8J56DRAFT_1119025 [Mycena floridula]KAJ7577297.1 hypothetical protein C8J56DRAFT_1113960 [Mycena floridula]
MQPSKLYSMASFILALLASDILAAPVASVNGDALQVMGRDSSALESRETTMDLEARGGAVSTLIKKKPRPVPNTCPYCGTTYATAQEAKECSDPPKKSGKLSCKMKF